MENDIQKKNSKIDIKGLVANYISVFNDHTITSIVVFTFLILGYLGINSNYLEQNSPALTALSAVIFAFGIGGFGINFIRPFWGFVVAPLMVIILKFVIFNINKLTTGLVKSSENIQNEK